MSRLAGVLVIVGVVAGLGSVVPVLEEPGYFGRIAANEGRILMGAGAQLVMVPACAGFALCLYPVVRGVSEALSLGFVGFRVIAAGFHFVGVILLPLFLVPGLDAATVEMLRVGRDLVNHVGVIVSLGVADGFLFFMLYRAKSVPRWLSVWGLAGAGIAVAASVLVLFRQVEIVGPAYLGMNAPMAVQSLVLAGWLMVKGHKTRNPPSGVRRVP
ncbi:DUF4386 domain-containing protein [Spongiactinospora rosea]|uniref:DUF4386 domain-containing protein n=1 Tax=Spongiactinospora rosea TaxID=2248750 RepID=A0A366M6Q0_9ACTN|nr:DUF4386 domain-containing protein [Spongiactinospora rosea]RBQ21209.1 DUF4386 domain-containing protein [Spongiactinospora rosea]